MIGVKYSPKFKWKFAFNHSQKIAKTQALMPKIASVYDYPARACKMPLKYRQNAWNQTQYLHQNVQICMPKLQVWRARRKSQILEPKEMPKLPTLLPWRPISPLLFHSSPLACPSSLLAKNCKWVVWRKKGRSPPYMLDFWASNRADLLHMHLMGCKNN